MVLIPRHGMLRPHGTIIATNCDGPEYQLDTIMCGHCNKHGLYKPGCGKQLGKCLKCMAVLCPNCAKEAETIVGPCMTLERRLDLYEAGKIATL